MPKTFSAYKGTARPAGLRPPLMLNAKYESGLWERLKERSAGLVRPIRRRDVPRGQGDPTKQRYLVRLNEYIAQISRVGNNYNQVVKAINTYLSRNMLPRQIDTLVACTRELKSLSEQVSELTRQLREEWLITVINNKN